MRYAIINNGILENIAVADDPAFAKKQGWVLAPENAEVGMSYENGQFLPHKIDLEKLASEARAKRNALLAESDWTQVIDAPVDQVVWAAYRQALRDITGQNDFPETIKWPVAP